MNVPANWIRQGDGSYSPPSRALRGAAEAVASETGQNESKTATGHAKRIRQNTKPLMNKLETEYFEHLQVCRSEYTILHIQAVTFKLANGVRYTPDFFIVNPPMAFEVKGKWVDGDSFPKLKMAASVYPEISWRLAWKKDGVWQEQIVLP
jgi:hypothetical protein